MVNTVTSVPAPKPRTADRAVAGAIALPALYIVAALGACTSLAILRTLGLVHIPLDEIGEKTLGEIFSRATLIYFIGLVAIALALIPTTRKWFFAERWRLIMAGLFVIGAAMGMADTQHPLGAEMNWVRYSTAGPLYLGGVLGIYYGCRGGNPVLARLFGVGFGLFMILGASDELFQFHETLQGVVEHGQQVEFGHDVIDSQDAPTLTIAMLALAGWAGIMIFRYVIPWGRKIAGDKRYNRPLTIFTVGVFVFALSQVMDSEDHEVTGAILDIITGPLGFRSLLTDPFWHPVIDLMRLSNSTEELLEMLAADSYLMTMGSLFSIGLLGF